MSRWPRRVPPAPVEPPAWVRHFDPAAWSGPTDWYAARRGWLAEHPQWDFVAERRERIARRRTARG